MLHEVINTTTTIIVDAEEKEGNVGTCVHTTRGINAAPVYWSRHATQHLVNDAFGTLRKWAAAKCIIRGFSVANQTKTEVELSSDKHFSKRANKSINYRFVQFWIVWENTIFFNSSLGTGEGRLRYRLHIDHMDMNKEENPHILSYLVKSHIADNFSNHLNISQMDHC